MADALAQTGGEDLDFEARLIFLDPRRQENRGLADRDDLEQPFPVLAFHAHIGVLGADECVELAQDGFGKFAEIAGGGQDFRETEDRRQVLVTTAQLRGQGVEGRLVFGQDLG